MGSIAFMSGTRKIFSSALLLLAASICAQGEFIWYHCSDTHFPMEQSEKTIQFIKQCAAKEKPRFIIVTGDLTEFGGADAFEKYRQSWKDCAVNVFSITGNHDNTWSSLNHRIQELHGGNFYSFKEGGITFFGLNTATLQDPRPSFSKELLVWLEKEIAKLPENSPVVAFCHHPFYSSEFASDHDALRALQILQRGRLLCVCTGHGHNTEVKKYAGTTFIMGGSTFGKTVGFNRYVWNGKHLKVTYVAESKEIELFDEDITSPKPPQIEFVPEKAKIETPWMSYEMFVDDKKIESFRLEDFIEGSHALRVVGPGGITADFEFQKPGKQILWRNVLDSSAKSSAVPWKDGFAVLGTDGTLNLLKKTGESCGSVKLGGPCAATPVVIGDSLFAGDGKGDIYRIRGTDKQKIASLGEPVLADLATDGTNVIAATIGGTVACVFPDGTVRWKRKVAQYSIESGLLLSGDLVYFSAWDTNVYCISKIDGDTKWKSRNYGATVQKAARYYSAGDSAPCLFRGRLFVCDRNYDLSIFDADDGKLLGNLDDAVACAAGGEFVALRRSKTLALLDSAGKILKELDFNCGMIPIPPVISGDTICQTSSTGTVLVWNPKKDRRFTVQATPHLYVMSTPLAYEKSFIICGMDGSVTCAAAK